MKGRIFMQIQFSLWALEDKIASAVNLLKENQPPEGYYLCFSGGKDSVVIHELAILAGVQFTAHHNLTTVEPPELLRFIRDYYPNVINEHAPLSMHALIVKHKIPPLKLARYCCAALKERGGRGRVKITGIRSQESPRRAKRQQVETDRHGSKFVHVIKDWSSDDVWEFIARRHLPYCSLYDEGFKRIGCVLCPFTNYVAAQRDIARWPSIAEYYRRACRKSYEVNQLLLEKGKQHWSSGDDMFNWWIESRYKYRVAEDCNQIPLFSEDDGSIL